MTNDLIVSNSSNYSIMPVMDIETSMQRRQAIIEFTKKVMVKDVHYGRIPGTNKDTLMKPGAEMLGTLFGLQPRFMSETVTEDWTGAAHDGEPFFYYRYRCELRRGDLVVGDGIGSCNSWEGKYRYRSASRVCPSCGQETIIKGKAEYGGGWLCFAKKGGCGAKYRDGDAAIEAQETGKVKNDNPQDIVNTIDKMAQKRALVAAILIAVNASEFFTQDVEDMDFGIIDGDFTENERPAKQPKAPQPQPQPATPLKPTVAMMKKLHALGVQKFGPEWDDARHELVGKLTDNRTQSSKDLSYAEVVKLAETVKSFADYEDDVMPKQPKGDDDNTMYDSSEADGAWNSMH